MCHVNRNLKWGRIESSAWNQRTMIVPRPSGPFSVAQGMALIIREGHYLSVKLINMIFYAHAQGLANLSQHSLEGL